MYIYSNKKILKFVSYFLVSEEYVIWNILREQTF